LSINDDAFTTPVAIYIYCMHMVYKQLLHV